MSPSSGNGRPAVTLGLQTAPRKGHQVLMWSQGLVLICPNAPTSLDESISPSAKETDRRRKGVCEDCGRGQNGNEKRQGERMARQGAHRRRGQGLETGEWGSLVHWGPVSMSPSPSVTQREWEHPAECPVRKRPGMECEEQPPPCTADQETSLEKPWFLQNVGGEAAATGGRGKKCDSD